MSDRRRPVTLTVDGKTKTLSALAGTAGGLAAQRPADDPELIEAKRVLKVERARRYIEELVSSEPLLTYQERVDLAAALLRGAS